MMSIFVFVIFYILAYLAGAWGDVILAGSRARSSLLFRFAFGGILMILVSVVTCIAGGALHLSSVACIIVAAVLICVAAVSGLFVKRRTAGEGKEDIKFPEPVDIAVYAVAALVVLVQVYLAAFYRYGGIGPLRDMGIATAVYESGHAFLADPMMTLIGCIASVSQIHPMRIIYGIMPLSFITLYYMCYCAVINTVITDRTKRIIAFAVIFMLNIWGYQSQYLTRADLLLSWFGIRVFVIHGLLNIFAVILIRYLQGLPDKEKKQTVWENDDLSEEWDMNKHKIINARNLAIALGVLAIALIGVVFFLNYKINRLYDATVNLQKDMNSRCSVYEFTTKDGETEGYLLRGSDGTLSFIGGGGAENAEELELFISAYGNGVTNWYVYGDDEENAGAMKKLTGSGVIHANNVYVVDRKEITELK